MYNGLATLNPFRCSRSTSVNVHKSALTNGIEIIITAGRIRYATIDDIDAIQEGENRAESTFSLTDLQIRYRRGLFSKALMSSLGCPMIGVHHCPCGRFAARTDLKIILAFFKAE